MYLSNRNAELEHPKATSHAIESIKKYYELTAEICRFSILSHIMPLSTSLPVSTPAASTTNVKAECPKTDRHRSRTEELEIFCTFSIRNECVYL